MAGGAQPNYFPVLASKDGGASWEYVSNLTDQVNGWGMSAQPALAELTEAMGGYPAGTVLGSANSWSNNGTRIDLYASTDGARTWEFVSHIAEGGRPNTTNGATPIWEPYLLQYKGELIAYYSDQRDPKHGQKLAHQTSTDLKTWGPVVNDVAYEQYTARPGMTVVDYIPPIDKWILVYERPIGNSSSYGVNYPVYYVMADDPRDFRKSEGLPIVINNSTAPNASPYVVWSPVGGKFGTIVVSDADRQQVYTNQFGGDVDKWEEHGVPAGSVYSRAIQIFKKYPDHLAIYGGETFDNIRGNLSTPFSITVVDLKKTLKTPV
ncbi:glycoside hydrolase family 93 protein [Sporormia fimetaria CBS 119925]|uniref:Glycoside hydrolase family 93 protein n=1 Tax=Sporormia fimetaria CBS 119925 TaxID=1340428 RepID=A0A6A6V2Q6_9PLEO|nr:glycoside hydrolase family 93 protein [Sporormia fimetaria CBS 119925]